ncbi:MAG: HAMP domain-containing histidine kinase, partial [Bacteroidia bacterium]|nr:HAMP domain-containing histidine kinase [Bacteroidia bacterium]
MANIYKQKQVWKILLLIGAAGIVAFSLFYTHSLVNELKTDEKNRIKLWALAIQKKAALVKSTLEIIAESNDEERKKAELYASAFRELGKNKGDFSFVIEVVKNNTTVPVILVDEKGKITGQRNLPDTLRENDTIYRKEQLEEMKRIHPPIVFDYLKGRKQFLYYKNSKLYEYTKKVFEEHIKSFISEVADNSAAVPVIMVDSLTGKVRAFGKIADAVMEDSASVAMRIKIMESENDPIVVDLGDGKHFIYYENSYLLKQLKYYPWVQFGIIGLFLLIAYTLFSTSRKAEQNQVWVGMSKETAHQLGTPLSALYGWLEYFKGSGANEHAVKEMARDLDRLKIITDRFSKIGSQPSLAKENIVASIENVMDYLKTRASKNVIFQIDKNSEEIFVNLSVPLFEWVIENLVKNAVDSMDGKGKIHITISDEGNVVVVDISDTGKGIPKSKFKTVFKPG